MPALRCLGRRRRSAVHDPATGRYDAARVTAALSKASMRVANDGGHLTCRPVFDSLCRGCAPLSPARGGRICWIDRERAGGGGAADLAVASGVATTPGAGMSITPTPRETARAMALFYALTGSSTRKGGNVLFPAVPTAGRDRARICRRAKHGAGRRHGDTPARTGQVGITCPRRISTRAVLEATPVSHARPAGLRLQPAARLRRSGARARALKALEFYVHSDLFMNPTAEMADIVLPVASALRARGAEASVSTSVRGPQAMVQLRPAVVPPRGEARSDTDIIFDLAGRLGLGEHSGTATSMPPIATSWRRAG